MQQDIFVVAKAIDLDRFLMAGFVTVHVQDAATHQRTASSSQQSTATGSALDVKAVEM